MVELHNCGALAAGLAVVGTLCYMAWLNELGAVAVAAATQDVDLARRQRLHLAAPLSLLQTVQATKLPFTAVPGMPSHRPPTSLMLPGREGTRIDVLAPARSLGATVRIPELEWHAEGVPHYDYLLEEPGTGAVLAGGHCITARLPRPERLMWHKLYSSVARHGAPEKVAKDLVQAATLAAILAEQGDEPLSATWVDVPAGMRAPVRKRLVALRRTLARHPQAMEQMERALG